MKLRRLISLLLALLLFGALFGCRRIHSPDADPAAPYPRTGKDNITVCLDAGHGFGDVGCEPAHMGCYEHEMTIALTRLVQAELTERGIHVILTHDGATYPDVDALSAEADRYGVEYKADKLLDDNIFQPYERVIWENVLDARTAGGLDLFVSIHINAIEENTEAVCGMSVDYCVENPNAAFLAALCEDLRGAYLDAALTDRFLVWADPYEEAFVVNKYTEVPSILIETGYATNETDATRLRDPAWQQAFAALLADRICAAFGK